MPKLNPGAPRSRVQPYIDKDALNCRALEGVSPGMFCELSEWDPDNDMLMIEQIYGNEGQPDRDVINRIQISGFTNPYSTSIRYFETYFGIISVRDK